MSTLQIPEDVRRRCFLLNVPTDTREDIQRRIGQGETTFQFPTEPGAESPFIELSLDSPAFQALGSHLVAKAFRVFPRDEEFDRPEFVEVFMLTLDMNTGCGEATFVPTDLRVAHATYSQFVGRSFLV